MVELDDIFEIMANEHRRRLLSELSTSSSQAEATVTVPTDVVREPNEVEQVRIELYHNHLPKLVDMELIEWYNRPREVQTGARYEEVQPVVELLENHAEELPGKGL